MLDQANDGINQRAAELFNYSYKDFLKEPYHSPEHILVDRRLENDRYIHFTFIDDRYGTDLNQDYFSGGFGLMGMSVMVEFKVYCYDKQLGDFVETCLDNLHHFFTDEEQAADFRLRSENLAAEMSRRGVVEAWHIEKIYQNIGLSLEDAPNTRYLNLVEDAYGQMQYDHSKFRIFIEKFKKIESAETEDWLKKFTDRLDELQINYRQQNDALIIDRYYRPV